MPSTIVHAGFALLLAVGLLKNTYDRKALAILLVIVVFPELDTVAGLWMPGAHRALLHNMTIPIAAAGLLYYDTQVREQSWLRARYDDWGVRVAWVALFVHVFAHMLLDYAHLDGINVFYPLYDRFFDLDGEIYLSTTDGIVQTFVDVSIDPLTGQRKLDPGAGGTTANTHVANPVEPSADPDPEEPIDRRFPITVHGWQLYLSLLGLFAVVARWFQSEPPEE